MAVVYILVMLNLLFVAAAVLVIVIRYNPDLTDVVVPLLVLCCCLYAMCQYKLNKANDELKELVEDWKNDQTGIPSN